MTPYLTDHPGVDIPTLRQLTDRYGTPMLVMDLRRVRANLDRIGTALQRRIGAAARPAFALKSCYLPGVVDTVRRAGWEVEVMSRFELEMALRAGVPGDSLTLTGLGWGEDTCRAALAAGVERFLVDTEADLESLNSATRGGGPTPQVYLRLNLGDRLPDPFVRADGKLGWCASTGLLDMVDAVRSRTRLSLAGLHLHQFNRLTEPDQYDAALALLAATARRLRAAGVDCRRIDLGGGLESIARLDQAGAPVERFTALIGRHFGPEAEMTEVITEFGRSVVGDAGYAVGRVTAVKPAAGRHWVIVDVPTNSLVPIPGSVFPPLRLADTSSRTMLDCAFSDGTGSPVSFAENVSLPAPEVGDLICLTEAGAYTTVFTELWAAPLPTLAVIGEDGRTLVREGPLTTRTTLESWYGPQAWQAGPDSAVTHACASNGGTPA